ncbi:C4-dicarboxylate transport sensor protein DctB [Tepidimonas alkaliphilus]|uniref:histidine kinase n=1 Tax=Tepidimonas alkaliphilus TaxID=2588942 RepID=A0A554WD41_9BURK|nr:ATP-binding protein [Tepidimonas alkaliphilus]TSE21489.1 C4-dicarboxylate transport sensor protein DctB [Tepidimonas alkaliphilus]
MSAPVWTRLWTRLSLPRLMLIVFIAVALASAAVVTALMLVWRLPQLRLNEQEAIERQADDIATLLQSELRTIEQVAATLAALLVERPQQERQRVQLPFFEHGLPLAEAIILTDANGVVQDYLLFQDPRARRHHDLYLERGFDFSQTEALRRTLPTRQAAWSDLYLSPLTQKPVIAYSLPSGGGWLVIELGLQHLSAFERHRQRDAQHGGAQLLLVTDVTGLTIESPRPQDRLQRKTFFSLETLQRIQSTGAWYGTLDYHGQRYIGQALRLPNPQWILFLGNRYDIAEEPVRAAWLIFGLTILAGTATGLLLMTWAARKMGRELHDLIDVAQSIAQGRYERRRDLLRRQASRDVAQLDQAIADMAAQIEKREERLRGIIETTPRVLIQVYDAQGRVLDWNPATERLLGIPKAQALQRTPRELYYGEAQHQAFMELLAQLDASGGYAGPFESQLTDAQGRTLWVLSTLFAIPGDGDSRHWFVCMDVDITAQKQLEEQLRALNRELEHKVQERTQHLELTNRELQQTLHELRAAQQQLVQSEKLAALGSLVAGVAHELNTPIGNARMALSTLLEHLRAFEAKLQQGLRRSDLQTLLEQTRTGSSIAEHNLQRAAELVTSFKQVAVDQTSSQRRRFTLDEVVQEILLTLHPQLKHAPVEVAVHVPSGIELDSYPGPLGQVLTNLIQNALLHGLEGLPHGRIAIEAGADATHWWLRVSDDGRGMTEEVRRRIFEPFFTTKLGQGGSGLGMHIVHNIVERVLGGSIEVDSALGQGARFTVRAPRVAPTEADHAAPAPQALAGRPHPR